MAEAAIVNHLTAPMRSMRESMRTICGEQYPQRVAPWKEAITRISNRERIEPLQAAIQLANTTGGNGLAVVATFAAYVELVEASTPTPATGANR
ncbi:MAG: hypothetical protein EPN40_09870 [Rhodanobacteraceae bacterium]|nr:MAG: hypothetical protein EPN40_09870 [Rhodanobacteraceae bacterium]